MPNSKSQEIRHLLERHERATRVLDVLKLKYESLTSCQQFFVGRRILKLRWKYLHIVEEIFSEVLTKANVTL